MLGRRRVRRARLVPLFASDEGFDVLDRLLSGTPIGRIVGGEAIKFGWQRLNAEYAKQFGIETPNWPPQAAQKS